MTGKFPSLLVYVGLSPCIRILMCNLSISSPLADESLSDSVAIQPQNLCVWMHMYQEKTLSRLVTLFWLHIHNNFLSLSTWLQTWQHVITNWSTGRNDELVQQPQDKAAGAA